VKTKDRKRNAKKTNEGRKLRDDILFGVFWSMLVAVALSVCVLGVYVVSGGQAFSGERTPLRWVIATYLGGGLSSGVLIGILRPITEHAWGAALTGFVCAAPLFMGILYLMGSFDWVGAIVCSAIVGPIVGYNFWKMFASDA